MKGTEVSIDKFVQPFARRLLLRDSTLSDESLQRMLRVIGPMQTMAAGDNLVCRGDRPGASTLLLQGWACRYNELADGRRQTLAWHLAGDFVDLHSFPMKVMDHGIEALTPCLIAKVPHADLLAISRTDAHLTRILWLLTLVDAAIMRQWLLGSGKRSSLEHAAHLICETYTRLKVVGLTTEWSFDWPLSQQQIGEALGISSVHVSRTLTELRTLGLFESGRGVAHILRWDELRSLAEFDPAYLMLHDEPR